MSFFISDALAQTAPSSDVKVPQADAAQATTTATTAATPAVEEPNPIMGLLPLFFIAFIFYFLMIRPQQKKYKDHQDMVSGITRGDRVVTSGGLIGKVSKVEPEIVFVDIADAVTVQIARQAITAVTDKNGAPKKADIKEAAQSVASEVDKAKKNSAKKQKVANDN